MTELSFNSETIYFLTFQNNHVYIWINNDYRM